MTKRREFLGMFGGSAFVTSGWTAQTSSDPFDGGDGSESNPYQISTIDQLQQISDLSASYILTDNLDGSTISNFEPIDTFTGIFDGDYYEISNVNITGNYSDVGLFKQLGGDNEPDGGVIKNLILTDCYIENTADYYGAGGIVGRIDPSGTVSECSFSGEVRSNEATGGIVGVCNGVIEKVYTEGQIDGDYSGGIAGTLYSDNGIYDAYSLIDGVSEYSGQGGIIGRVNSDSVEVRRVFFSGENFTYPIGMNIDTATVEGAYWDNTVGSAYQDGGPEVTGLTTDEMSGETATENMPEFDFDDTWQTTSGYPELAWETSINASFSIAPSSPGVSDTITVDASGTTATNSINSYEWDFSDDGNFESTGETATTSFDAAGEYTITLRVSDDQGNSGTVSQTITVTNTAPTATFEIPPTEPEVGQEVTFDASGSSDDSGIQTYEWDLNDDGTFEASGQTTSTSFDSTGDYTITLRVTDTDGVSSTAEQTLTVSQTAFQQIKESHLETAQTVDDATVDTVQQGVDGIGATSEAQAANEAYTEAVENGEIDESTAIEAIRRLNRGCGITLTVAEEIGSYPEVGDTNDVDLTQSMAAPTIQTALDLAMGIQSASKASNSSDNSNLLLETAIDTAKDQVQSGINSLVKYMLGESSDVAGTVNIEASQLAEDLVNNTYATAADVNSAIQDVKDRITGTAATAIQTYVEQGNAIGTPEVPQLTGTVFEDNPLTLDGGVTLMYTALSADQVASDGLAGSTDTATSAASTTEQNIRDQAATSESDIADIAALSEDTGLGTTLIDLVESPSLYDAITGIIGILSSIVGSIPDALATGAGIGGLIEINIRHHVGLYSVIQGETV